MCKSDSALESHFRTAKAFKGTSRIIQDELLDSILVICKNYIKKEIEESDYLAVMCDETTDISNTSQMAIVFRYVVKNKPVERFWGFFNPPNLTGEALSEILLKELGTVVSNEDKLIAQTYDGAAALSGKEKGVQTRIKEVYKNAHYVHCYAHQLNLVIEKATSKIKEARVFFNSLSGIPAFFSKSAQRTAAMDKLSDRIPQPSPTRWNFKSRTVNKVFESRDKLIQCCDVLEKSQSKETGLAAAGIKRMLCDQEFIFWLEFYSKIMPQVEILFAQFQSRSIEPTTARNFVTNFTSAIKKVKLEYGKRSEQNLSGGSKKRRSSTNEMSIAATHMCDIIVEECTNRFRFTGHLESSKLLLEDHYERYLQEFPSFELSKAVEAYPMLDEIKLKTELTVLYGRDDMCSNKKIADLPSFLFDNNLKSAFSETVKLLKILLTTPMTSTEAERCFSTLKRIKTVLRNSMLNQRLTALAMISTANEIISGIHNFNEKVIDHFATSKTRKMEFIFE